MDEKFIRTGLLLGEEGLNRLARARVAVFGVGGVGGHTVEALVRSGVGKLDLIDKDVVSLSNINRQIIATARTVGQYKTEAMKERILEINPHAEVAIHNCFFLPETAKEFDFGVYDYVVDAVDTVTAKIELAVQAQKAGVPIISSMGAGNKLDPGQFEVADIYMRRELRKRGIEKLKAVYSKEEPRRPRTELPKEAGKVIPGSIAFVPSVAGLMIAGEVIRDLCSVEK